MCLDDLLDVKRNICPDLLSPVEGSELAELLDFRDVLEQEKILG